MACREVTSRARIGTCGFGLAQASYSRAFSCVEIQHTFYQPPKLQTLERWRTLMPSEFEFVIKAWQLITHDARSPTYRRLKVKLSAIEREEAGYFRDSAIVRQAWETTLASAKALRARTILFQCPASFTQTAENIANLEKFFSSLERRGLNLGWEPRGNWDTDVVKSICDELRLWHVVDPFLDKTTTPKDCYFRLHGRGGWRYEYEDGELKELALAMPKRRLCYVFFNNYKMIQDALRFCKGLAVIQDR
ncbi:MAG: DUF72 domain-containing protein [Pyrinomonadaceae bacterium]